MEKKRKPSENQLAWLTEKLADQFTWSATGDHCKSICVEPRPTTFSQVGSIYRVPDQNGVSLLYIMLEIHHSGWQPSICEMSRLCKAEVISKQNRNKKQPGDITVVTYFCSYYRQCTLSENLSFILHQPFLSEVTSIIHIELMIRSIKTLTTNKQTKKALVSKSFLKLHEQVTQGLWESWFIKQVRAVEALNMILVV